MTAYISVGSTRRTLLNKELMMIIDSLNEFKIKPFIFFAITNFA